MFKKLVAGSIAALAAIATVAAWRGARWWRTWGVNAADSVAALPGDDLIADAAASDTRGITIDAPADAVWPWLVQMGYGRAGWYSYDTLDMKGSSADRILPEHATLALGDVVPTDPAGGFEVRVLDPGRTLVLYVDASMVAARNDAGAADGAEATPAGLAASGRFLESATPPDFAASWTFHLRPEPDGGTRFLERVRLGRGESTGVPKALMPVFGFGVFVMMQRQMVGIRQRAERLARA
ncbi:MAG TPA: hypothetical protein VES19_05920 [Candidatus Limnocylindrales bacterium]|nr:hypothetical protein [Candidatus Limnocylindrales bacterium]